MCWIALLLLVLSSVFQWTGVASGSRDCDAERLNQLLNGVLRSLQYMDLHKPEINFDGLIGVRMTADQVALLAENMSRKDFRGKDDLIIRLQYLANMSNYVIEKGTPYVQSSEPDYFNELKGMLEPGSWKLRYPQRSTDQSLQKKPLPCSEAKFFEQRSDVCLSEIVRHSISESDRCNISAGCMDSMTAEGYKDYALTHELIYLQLAEMHGCVPTLVEMGYNLSHIVWLQNAFCANVLRDAVRIARNRYPYSHRDLFTEQIAICGMYGFKDFWNEDWIDEILGWQEDNGCYIHTERWNCEDELQENKIEKRNDKLLSDGCSSHMTTVALIAMAVNVRFCAEAFAERGENQGS